jgi:hypothetical protein
VQLQLAHRQPRRQCVAQYLRLHLVAAMADGVISVTFKGVSGDN